MTKRQELLLAQLAEEAAEVIQAVAKIQRFGLKDTFEGKTNQERLISEVHDFQVLREMLGREGIITNTPYEVFEIKRDKVEKWLAYSIEGPRTDVTTPKETIEPQLLDHMKEYKIDIAKQLEERNEIVEKAYQESLAMEETVKSASHLASKSAFGSEGFKPMIGGKEVRETAYRPEDF